MKHFKQQEGISRIIREDIEIIYFDEGRVQDSKRRKESDFMISNKQIVRNFWQLFDAGEFEEV